MASKSKRKGALPSRDGKGVKGEAEKLSRVGLGGTRKNRKAGLQRTQVYFGLMDINKALHGSTGMAKEYDAARNIRVGGEWGRR